MKLNVFKTIWLAFIAAIFLVGCTNQKQESEDIPPEQVEESSSSIENVEKEESVALIDQRLVPEMSQVIADFKSRKDITLSNDVEFQIKETFSQTQNHFQLSVDQMLIYEVESINQSLQSEFNYEEEPGAIAILEVSITNLTDDTMYYPIEGLRMSYQSADTQMHPSSELYPSLSGDLTGILKQSNGEIGPGMAVNGYVVYSFDAQEWKEASEFGNVYLTVVAPQADSDSIAGVGASVLGNDRALYLPLNEDVEEDLALNNQMIQDRLSTEWWGNKTLLAQERINDTSEDGDVTTELINVEMSDFEPRESYKENFENFLYGQVIVSIEYKITNDSKYDLLPVDGTATLQIGDDAINSDYVLINDYNGTILKPGESYTTIKTFALDKMRYQELWQGEPIYIAINAPVSPSEEFFTEGLLYFFDYSWTPKLNRFIDSNMNVVSENPIKEDEEEEIEEIEDIFESENDQFIN